MRSPGAQVPNCVHPTAKWCTPGAGCTLNFEQCVTIEKRYRFEELNDYRGAARSGGKRPPGNQEVGGSNPAAVRVGKNENWTFRSSLHIMCPN